MSPFIDHTVTIPKTFVGLTSLAFRNKLDDPEVLVFVAGSTSHLLIGRQNFPDSPDCIAVVVTLQVCAPGALLINQLIVNYLQQNLVVWNRVSASFWIELVAKIQVKMCLACWGLLNSSRFGRQPL